MKIGQWLQLFSARAASLLSHGGHADAGAYPAASQLNEAPLWRGLSLPWRRQAHNTAGPSVLEDAREAFLDALRDIDAREACCLSMRIRYAHSMQALWHFRTDVFLLVSLHRSEREAHTRLANLNQHFPTRSPRSGFGALLD